MKPLYVGKEGRIIKGILAGHRGKVVGFDSEIDEAMMELDSNTFVTVSSEVICQESHQQLNVDFVFFD